MTARGGPPDSSEAGPLHRNRPTATNAAATTLQVPDQSRSDRRQEWRDSPPRQNGHDDLGIAKYLHSDAVTIWLSSIKGRLVPPGTAVPIFASAEWHKADDALRLTSALQAAKAHYVDGLYSPQRLEDELSRVRWVQDCEDAAEWAELASWVRRMANVPTYAELVERRAEVVRRAAGGAR